MNQTQSEYVRTHAIWPAKVAKSMHRNEVAKALGEFRDVPAEVLADYVGTDWSEHPLSANRVDLKPPPPPPEPPRPPSDGSAMAAHLLAALSLSMAGMRRRQSPVITIENLPS